MRITVYSLHCILYTVYCALYSCHSTQYTVHCTIHYKTRIKLADLKSGAGCKISWLIWSGGKLNMEKCIDVLTGLRQIKTTFYKANSGFWVVFLWLRNTCTLSLHFISTMIFCYYILQIYRGQQVWLLFILNFFMCKKTDGETSWLIDHLKHYHENINYLS